MNNRLSAEALLNESLKLKPYERKHIAAVLIASTLGTPAMVDVAAKCLDVSKDPDHAKVTNE